jgi:hypothetical protein
MPAHPRTRIMNYTTGVAVKRTLDEITTLLVRGGARAVQTEYDDDGRVAALNFVVRTALGNRAFHVVVETERVLKVLQAQTERRYHTREQAERVAWRIIKDWLEAQMTLVQLQLIGLDQAMLGFMVVRPGDNRTAYELYTEEQLALPEPG